MKMIKYYEGITKRQNSNDDLNFIAYFLNTVTMLSNLTLLHCGHNGVRVAKKLI